MTPLAWARVRAGARVRARDSRHAHITDLGASFPDQLIGRSSLGGSFIHSVLHSVGREVPNPLPPTHVPLATPILFTTDDFPTDDPPTISTATTAGTSGTAHAGSTSDMASTPGTSAQ